MKKSLVTLIVVFALIQIFGQNKSNNMDMDINVTGSGKLPAGWHLRLDKSNANPKDLKLIENKGAFHFETGPAGIYYNPKQVEKGKFKIEGTFVQLTESKHPEAYGLFFAGQNLSKDNQYYLYFLVRQDGKYLIKERKGDKTPLIVNWTADKAVNAKDKNGRTENLLAIQTEADSVHFYCNGTEITSLSKKKIKSADGQVGLRINHNLNVEVSGYNVKEF